MKVYGYEPSMIEYFGYTTEERRRSGFGNMQKKYGTLQKGLAVLAMDEQDRLLSEKQKHII